MEPEIWMFYKNFFGHGKAHIINALQIDESSSVILSNSPISASKPPFLGEPAPALKLSFAKESKIVSQKDSCGILVIDDPWPSLTINAEFPYRTNYMARLNSEERFSKIEQLIPEVTIGHVKILIKELEEFILRNTKISEASISDVPDRGVTLAIIPKEQIHNHDELKDELSQEISKEFGIKFVSQDIKIVNELPFVNGNPKIPNYGKEISSGVLKTFAFCGSV
jgi:acyl-coenzyme A synthetase/AMP-(fatty) acid ligase